MERLNKIDSLLFYRLWQSLAICIATAIAVFACSKLFPGILTPVFAILAAGLLYTRAIQRRANRGTCVIVPYAFVISFVIYAFVTVLLSLLPLWGVKGIHGELLITENREFIPTLIFMPIGFLTLLYIRLKHRSLSICVACRRYSQQSLPNLSSVNILEHEAQFQINNLLILFGFLTVAIWGYFLVFYVHININARDWYVFSWLATISFVIDIFYFIYRYYNLYLDLLEEGRVISIDETMENTSMSTYLRFYVICRDYIYCDVHSVSPSRPNIEVIDTPFFTRTNANGISIPEVKRTIERMTGVKDGELRFFFGRQTEGTQPSNILRYFYFLDGNIEDYPELRTKGEWVPYSKIKQIYTLNPSRLAPLSIIDTTRLGTIIITHKTYDSNGIRKSRIKSYQPTFDLIDVRNSDLDFQSDKWIQISIYNSDKRFFKFRRFLSNLMGKNTGNNEADNS